ncbi:hypothetical protein [Lyticum sinuosum]|uniref:Lipoprotein n=1 Tax=Lyticum sinuosum TaxID=1332059 RepID=A0AAE4VJV3_9RICK|nr:hypothetical protein [Lyticum sinuosum]MDZ5761097.1 hypothetical protein [Lyticum sinuosum]
MIKFLHKLLNTKIPLFIIFFCICGLLIGCSNQLDKANTINSNINYTYPVSPRDERDNDGGKVFNDKLTLNIE